MDSNTNIVKRLINIVKSITPRNIVRTIRYVAKNGVSGLKRKILHAVNDPLHYNDWFKRHRITEDEIQKQKVEQSKFEYLPKVSILVPIFNTPIDFLKDMINSVINQSYENWELCLANGSSENEELKSVIDEFCKKDSRIKCNYLKENLGISGNTNGAIEIATGDLIALLDHDDAIEPDALFEVVKAFQGERVDIVYTDEDKANADLSVYMDPNFKPDFSIDLFRSHNYITHFFVVKKDIVDEIGGFRSEYDGSQDYDIMFRAIEKADVIFHVPKVLYHWRMCEGSTADKPESKMYCYEAGRKAIAAHYDRMGIKASVEHTELWGMYHTVYETLGNPLISIIIANKDHIEDLDKCVRSIINKSIYTNFEFIIVENNSEEEKTFTYYDAIQKEFDNIKVIFWKEEFNYAAINNFGVENAAGEYLLLLNNDTELISENALGEMLGICMRDDVGIVGAKLLYADNTVQHAGVVLGFSGYAAHIFNGIARNDYGFMMRARINCNYSAVTGACLMTSRKIYNLVGGLSEEFKVAGNDIDFCLKVRDKGFLVVYNAYSEWYHYESKSRGYEDTPEKKARFENEIELFRKKWGEVVDAGDPYYNSNFEIELGEFALD